MQAFIVSFGVILISLLIYLVIKFENKIQVTKNSESAILILGTIFAIIIRIILIHGVNGDMTYTAIPWTEFIKKQGFFGAFKEGFYDVTPLYLYWLAFASLIPLPVLWSIKILPIIFNFIGAFYIYKILKEFLYKNSFLPSAAYLGFLFLPNIFVNSAYWGQYDSIFSTFIIISLYCILKNKNLQSIIFYSVAFALKIQAIFVFPVFILLWLKKEIKIWHFFIIPFTYFLSILPAAIAGRPIIDLMTIYFNLMGTGKAQALSANAPTVYQFFDYWDFGLLTTAGISFTFAIVCLLIFIIWKRIKFDENRMKIIEIFFIFSVIVPFFLPRMHERYFFIADTIGLLYFFYKPKKFYLPVIIWLCSILSYAPFLWNYELIPFIFLSTGILFVVIKLLYDLIDDAFNNTITSRFINLLKRKN